MKKKSSFRSAFFNPRVLLGFVLCSLGALVAMVGFGIFSGESALAQKPKPKANISAKPQVVPLIGPFSQSLDLRALPYIAPNEEHEEQRLMRHPLPKTSKHKNDAFRPVRESNKAVAMPTPLATFAGMNSVQSGCGCLPPDTDGDVGPNHYIQSVNSSIKIFDKTGNALNGVNGTTYNSFFAAMGPTTPCGASQNDGDGFVFYDQIADRWVVSDFAFPGLPSAGPFYQCVGVSKTSDPVSGGWWLYAVQVDPSNPTWVGDYPKLALWPDAYYLSVNLFDGPTLGFRGARVYALPRAAMINGTGAPNAGAVAFTILPAGLGDSYSLVPATFRAGLAPPAGAPEYFLSVDSPASAGVSLTQVHAWQFHVDFATPANSTFGVGANHTPNGEITVNGFVDAFTTTTLLVPQNGTTRLLDTLGDKLMTPLVYQNLGGTESLYVSQTVNNNQGGTGPTAVRWYQFNVTGNTIPATAVQQQTFNNGGDGLWRWMPSITVDGQGNMAIGYSVSSSTSEPSIRYAGRLAGDPLNTLAQGEALMIAGAGHQTSSSGRWGDYSALSIDPVDNATFWHTNEYFTATSSAGWNTRVGNFKFVSAPTALSAVSRKTHGGAGTFDVNLPLTGNVGIECRTGGATNDYSMVVTFASPVTVTGSPQAQVTSGTALIGSGGVSNGGAVSVSGAVVTIPLTSVANAQRITVKLSGVSDGTNVGDVSISMGMLLGDTGASGDVNASDVSQTKAQSGQTVGIGNFREDVTADGSISASDISLVKAQSGTSLP